MRKSRHRPIDAARVSAGLARAGMDPRSWVEYATVCLVDDEGRKSYERGTAIFVTPEGFFVDVVVEPGDVPVTCRYNGIHGGSSATIYAPLHAGDLVVVGVPGGEHGSGPVVIAVCTTAHNPMPAGSDGKPIFQNDRVLVHAKDVPIDIRTAGGARLTLGQDGQVVANEGDRGVARVQDTTKLTMTPDDLSALIAALLACGAFVPTGTPPAPVGPIIFTKGEITSASGSVKAGG